MIALEPSLHGGHCPHDSIDRNREKRYAASTMHVVSSYTMNPAEPMPLPIAWNPS